MLLTTHMYLLHMLHLVLFDRVHVPCKSFPDSLRTLKATLQITDLPLVQQDQLLLCLCPNATQPGFLNTCTHKSVAQAPISSYGSLVYFTFSYAF